MTFNFQFEQITRWVIVAFLVIILLMAVWLVRDILLLTLTAIIFALLLTTPIRLFVRLGLRRAMAVLLTLLLVVLAIILVTALILPGLIDQFRQLVAILQSALNPGNYLISAPILDSDHLSILTRRIFEPGNPAAGFDFLRGVDLSGVTSQVSNQLFSSITNLSSQVFPFLGSLASGLLSILIVVFMGLYFVADPGVYQRGAISLLPIGYRTRAHEILNKIEIVLRNFLQAQIILMVLTGSSTALALTLLGIPLGSALGTITGLFSFVPNFGPLVALIPIMLVVLLNAPTKLLAVFAVFYALQTIQSQLIAPLLVGQELHMPPVVILLAQIIAGVFFGFMGLLLSVPLAAIVVVLVREIYIHDILGDRTIDLPDESPPLLERERVQPENAA